MFVRTRFRTARWIAVLGIVLSVWPLTAGGAVQTAVAAQAQPASPATPFQAITISAHAEQQGAMLFITGQLADDAPLPARIELSAPAGSQLQWAGEILGGELADDITAQPQSTTTSDTVVHSFTLTKARVAQLEAFSSEVFTVGPSVTDVKLRWTPVADVPSVLMQVRLPQNAGISVPAEGAQTSEADPGFVYYSKTFSNVKAGQPLELAVSYVPPAGGTGGPPVAQRNSAMPVIVVLLAVVAFAWFGYLVYRKSAAADAASAAAQAPRRERTQAQMSREESHATGVDDTDADDAFTDAEDTDADDAFTDAEDTDVDEAADTDDASAEDTRPAKNKLPMVMAIVVVGVVAVLVAVSSNAGGGVGVRQVTADAVVMKLTDADENAATTVPIVMTEGGDVEHESDHVFKALQMTPGVGKVSVALDGKSVTVGYDSATVTEPQILAALAAGGYPAQK